MMVFRSATFLTFCLLLVSMGVQGVNLQLRTKHRDRDRARGPAPVVAVAVQPQPEANAVAAFKEQAKTNTEAAQEAVAKANVHRSEEALTHEMKMLDLQQQQVQLLLKLKQTHEAREQAERELVHHHLVAAQAETARLVQDLTSAPKNKLLIKLRALNDVISDAFLPHKSTAHTTQPSSIAIDTKLQQKMKQTPAATPTPAQQLLDKKIEDKATEVIDAQLDGILNSQELAYIQAHNNLATADASSTDTTIVEADHGALPGETPDEHFNRLNKEADALMAQAYPFIKCEGVAAGTAGGGTGGTGGTAATAMTGATGGNSTATAGTAATGANTASTAATATTGTTGTAGGALVSADTAATAAAPSAGGGTAATAASGATGVTGDSSSSSTG